MEQRHMHLLPAGGRIAIVAPSGAIAPELLHNGVGIISAAGYKVEIMPHVEGFATSVFAAPDNMRASDLEEAILRNDIDAIICARGGYGAVRTLQCMHAEVLDQCNKWIVGFSDITAIHSALSRRAIASLHGPMLKFIATNGMHHADVSATFRAMQTGECTTQIPTVAPSRTGRAEGIVVGGNLSLLCSLRSTPAEFIPEGALLFIEDLSEYLYHIDRMMQNLRYSGVLQRIGGLIVGDFTELKDGRTPFGMNVNEIIAAAVSDYNYPVMFGYRAGHSDDRNAPLIFGRQATLEVTEAASTLAWHA